MLKLSELHKHIHGTGKLTQANYDASREEQEMAADQSEIEKAIRGDGGHPMRNLLRDVCAELRTSLEAPIDNDRGGVIDRRPPVPAMPYGGGTFRARCDVPCGDERHYIKNRHASLDRVETAVFLLMCENWDDPSDKEYYERAFFLLEEIAREFGD